MKNDNLDGYLYGKSCMDVWNDLNCHSTMNYFICSEEPLDQRQMMHQLLQHGHILVQYVNMYSQV